MEWSDEGIVLATRSLGETSVVLSLLTRAHGRHSGLVRRGAGRRTRGLLQPGNRLAARWRARLADHLGTMSCEPGHVLASAVMADRGRLAAVAAACAVTETALPEREPLPAVFELLAELIAAVETDAGWRAAYVRWELGLLTELGFGLDSRPLRGDRDDGRSGLRLAPLRPRSLGRGGRALERPAAALAGISGRCVGAGGRRGGGERSGGDRAFPAAPRLCRAGPGAAGGARAVGGRDRARRSERGESGGVAAWPSAPAPGRSRTFRSARRSPSVI